MKPLVSVIIPSKNSAKHLAKVFKRLKTQTYRNIELILVDNNSTDKTKEIARKYTDKVYNIGPERSVQMNYGASVAKGKYIFTVGSDCEVEKNVVKECVDLCESGADGVMVPLRHIGPGFWTACKALERECYVGDDDLESPWFVRRSSWNKIKGLDETLIAGEDWDIAYRLRKAGADLTRNKSYINHHLGRYPVKEVIRKNFYYGKNLIYYLERKNSNTAKQIPFFRKAYIRKWKLLVTHPIKTCGFMYLKVMESIAVLAGVIYIKVLGSTPNYSRLIYDVSINKSSDYRFSFLRHSEWLKLLKLASNNRVLYVFSSNLLKTPHLLTSSQQVDLKTILKAGETRLDMFRKTIKFLERSLGKEGVHYLVVKTFKNLDYITFDVDTLVKYEDFEKAQQVLRKYGCKVSSHPRKQGKHQRNCTKKGLLNIDLHRKFFWQGLEHIDSDFPWAKKSLRNINGINAPCPSLETDFLLHNKQLMYERYYITILDFYAVTSMQKLDQSAIRKQIKKYKWEKAYKSLVDNISKGSNRKFPVFIPYTQVLSQYVEIIKEQKTFPLFDFLYYHYVFLRYYLSGKDRMPYYRHWFDFTLL